MRTSTQLTTTGQCDRHPHANITSSADYITRAAAQREVVMRILQGEPIDDIKGEIDRSLPVRIVLGKIESRREQT